MVIADISKFFKDLAIPPCSFKQSNSRNTKSSYIFKYFNCSIFSYSKFILLIKHKKVGVLISFIFWIIISSFPM